MSFDVCCAICGVVAGSLSRRPEISRYNADLISPSGLLWLEDIRLLFEQTHFPVHATGNGEFMLFINGMAAPMNPQRYEVYEERKDGEENLLAFPVHATCIGKLRKRLGAEPLDPRLLFQVFQTYGYLPNGRAQYLNIDYYGTRNFIPGPTWVVQEGAERFVTSPDSSDRLRKWFPPVQATLPRANTEADSVPRFSAPRVKLPTEIVLQIMYL